jgi:hypothetical protein
MLLVFGSFASLRYSVEKFWFWFHALLCFGVGSVLHFPGFYGSLWLVWPFFLVYLSYFGAGGIEDFELEDWVLRASFFAYF